MSKQLGKENLERRWSQMGAGWEMHGICEIETTNPDKSFDNYGHEVEKRNKHSHNYVSRHLIHSKQLIEILKNFNSSGIK